MILGLSGPVLTPAEKAFFGAAQPWGFILFGRNVESLEQVRALVEDARSAVGWQAPVLIDQEGGTVRRLRPPLVRDYPAADVIGALFAERPEVAREAAWATGRLMAADLFALGIDIDCAPVLDMPPEAGSGFIARRAYGSTPQQVTTMAQAVADGLVAGGVQPVVKHIPGHGRGFADSHKDLPVVDAPLEVLRQTDFRPFSELQGIRMAMTCHCVFSAVDPYFPASASRKVMEEIIRGEIGFDGLVMSDDISMNALSGDIADRAKAVLGSGLDIVLHCNGVMAEMEMVAGVAPALSGASLARANDVIEARPAPDDADLAALGRKLDDILAMA